MKKKSLEERLRAKLGPKDPATCCIEWTGWRTKKEGYGQIWQGDKMVYTHRLAWELKHGPIPEGMDVLHKCDNPPCCNDEHLYPGTAAANAADRESKGRGNQPKGENNGKAKLTGADVVEIRRRLASGENQRKIAGDFGLDRTTVRHIKTGKTWKHI